jgi:hypothetical protein
MPANRQAVLKAMMQHQIPELYREQPAPDYSGATRPMGQIFGVGSQGGIPQADIDRLRTYVKDLPQAQEGKSGSFGSFGELRPYTPSPSENRSFYLRQNLGPTLGRQVNDALDWVDPVTPVMDFAHRRKQGAPWGWEDTSLATGVALNVAPLGGPIARKALRNSGRSLDGAAKRQWPDLHNRWHTGKIERQLEKPNPKTTGFGFADEDLVNEINNIRALEGEPTIGTSDIRVYSAVLEKLQKKRIGLDKMTPKEVAQMIYRLVHDKGVKVERSKYPTAQRLVSENIQPADVGFIGKGPKDDVSVKSVYPADPKQLRKIRER